MTTYFSTSASVSVTYAEFMEIVCEVHFREIFSTLVRNELGTTIPPVTYMNKQYFVHKIS